MDINKILSADILDIVFEGRNKQYGAYQLRKTYNSRLAKALIITASLILLVFLGSVFANLISKNKHNEQIEVVDTQIAEIKQNEPPPPPPPPPPPTPPPPPEVNQIKFTPPKIVKDEEVKQDEKIEEIKEEQAISTQTVKSENTEQIVQAPVEGVGQPGPPAEDENKIFTKVEIEAGFPGGNGAWLRYLQNTLADFENEAPPGTYRVLVKFIVSKDGMLSSVEPLTSFGYGMEERAIRAIKTSKKWTPAVQNGRNVNAYHTQPITYVVAGD
ncbi:MAG: energy transducer TonB [Sphingobacteriales bacterium]|nr:energy transducer TonB [Sphingobacteriales bacterium]